MAWYQYCIKTIATLEHFEKNHYSTETHTTTDCLLTVECLTVPLWYKQQVTLLNPKFNQIRPKNDTFRAFIRLKNLPKSFGIFQLMIKQRRSLYFAFVCNSTENTGFLNFLFGKESNPAGGTRFLRASGETTSPCKTRYYASCCQNQARIPRTRFYTMFENHPGGVTKKIFKRLHRRHAGNQFAQLQTS